MFLDRILNGTQRFLEKTLPKRAYRGLGRLYGVTMYNSLGALFRLRDSLTVAFLRPEMRAFHRKLRQHLHEQQQQWSSYRYAGGYLYQGYRRLALTGFRSTEDRWHDYNEIFALPAGACTLDIGANCGFVSLEAARTVRQADALEINPFLVAIARDAAKCLAIDNFSIVPARFEDFQPTRKYDVVFSFANHATMDGNTQQSFQQYVDKTADLVESNGHLLFESHELTTIDADIEDKLAYMERHFEIIARKLLRRRHSFDIDRLLVVFRRRV